ncbi:MAG: glutaredoxin family protein [Anaerolineae bacterium]
MEQLTFFTKPGCHLCEDGEWMVNVALRGRDVGVTYVDISGDAALQAAYGNRIPVLKHPRRPAELDWPFTPDTILAWLDGPATR